MSNSGIIVFEDNKELGLYLHWNGGRDSVEAFLKYCKLTKKTGGFQYGMLSLAQVIKNWGIGLGDIIINPFDYGSDNGIYIVDKKWNIIDRKNFNGIEQNEYDLDSIDKELKHFIITYKIIFEHSSFYIIIFSNFEFRYTKSFIYFYNLVDTHLL